MRTVDHRVVELTRKLDIALYTLSVRPPDTSLLYDLLNPPTEATLRQRKERQIARERETFEKCRALARDIVTFGGPSHLDLIDDLERQFDEINASSPGEGEE